MPQKGFAVLVLILLVTLILLVAGAFGASYLGYLKLPSNFALLPTKSTPLPTIMPTQNPSASEIPSYQNPFEATPAANPFDESNEDSYQNPFEGLR